MASRAATTSRAIIAAFAAALDVPVPLFSACAPFYSAAIAQGFGEQDTAAVAEVLQALAGLDQHGQSGAV